MEIAKNFLAFGGDLGPSVRRSSRAGAAFVLLSIGIFLLSTRHGIGVAPDSVGYMQLGVVRHFAPVYTAMLKAVSTFGVDVVTAAKWLGLLFISINSLLIWRLSLIGSGSIALAAVATALIVLSPNFIAMHTLAMSEPVFLFLTLCALFLYLKASQTHQRLWYALAGAVVGVAMLTRFASASVMAGLCLTCLVQFGRPLRQKLIDTFVIGLSGVAIFLIWMTASELIAGQSTGREFAFNGNPDSELWGTAVHALSTMLLPQQAPLFIRFAFLVFVLGAALWLAVLFIRRQFQAAAIRTQSAHVIATFSGIFCVVYVVFILLSVQLEANLPINGRYLLPLYIFGVLAVTAMLAQLRRDPGQTAPVLAALGLALAVSAALMLGAHTVRMTLNVRDAFANGIGYASLSWDRSPIVQAIAQLPPGAAIYTNAPDVVAFVTRRCADYVPVKVNRFTNREQPGNTFQMQMEAIDQRLNNDDVFVAYLSEIGWRFYLAGESELATGLQLEAVVDTDGGRIYRRAPSARKATPEIPDASFEEWRPGFGGCTCRMIETQRWPQCR